MSKEHLWNGTKGKTKVLRETPFPMPLYPSQNTHRQTWEKPWPPWWEATNWLLESWNRL